MHLVVVARNLTAVVGFRGSKVERTEKQEGRFAQAWMKRQGDIHVLLCASGTLKVGLRGMKSAGCPKEWPMPEVSGLSHVMLIWIRVKSRRWRRLMGDRRTAPDCGCG